MLSNRTVAVVVSAYNEASQIGYVLESIPDFVDRIVLVDDASTDNTVERALEFEKGNPRAPLSLKKREPLASGETRSLSYTRADQIKFEIFQEEGEQLPLAETLSRSPDGDRLTIIRHKSNHGKGAAQASGLQWCRSYGIDCTVTMDGDGQMDPSELERICRPVVDERIDYVKGNRLRHRAASRIVPKVRYFGNSILSILTKIASGYWTVWDAQTGYTALSLNALESIEINKIYPRYGVPNDMLVKMNIAGCTLREVPIKPVYRVGEKSKMRVLSVIPKISFLLIRLFFKRLWTKYFFRSFHPLFLLYHLSIMLFAIALPLFVQVFYQVIWLGHKMPVGNYLAVVLMFLIAFQSMLFAMWMDIQDNASLVR